MKLDARRETWPVAGVFRISRGAVTSVEVMVVEVEDGGLVGRGEGCPEARYREGAALCLEQLEGVRAHAEAGLDRAELQDLLPAGAARNALDCALWDLEAKRRDAPAWRLAGLSGMHELVTAYTISLDRPETMGERASASADRPLLKLKLGGEGGAPADIARVEAVRKGAPKARLIVDANEGVDARPAAPGGAAARRARRRAHRAAAAVRGRRRRSRASRARCRSPPTSPAAIADRWPRCAAATSSSTSSSTRPAV